MGDQFKAKLTLKIKDSKLDLKSRLQAGRDPGLKRCTIKEWRN